MADIRPFSGVRFASSAGDPAVITAPPYDVIGAEERDQLERSDPHNAVRLILGRDEPGDDTTDNKYTRARETLRAWLDEGTLVVDGAETFTLYEQRYTLGGTARIQRGLIAAVSLEDGNVLPHEKTMTGPVADRLELMRTTRANLEPIFCLYTGEDGAGREAIARVAATAPETTFTTEDGVEHRLWTIADPRTIEAIRAGIGTQPLLIADGHHRHRTAQVYRDERRAIDGAGPWDAMMMFVADADWAGPSVLPIHRTIAGIEPERALDALRGTFDIETASASDLVGLERELEERRAMGHTLVLLGPDAAWWLTLADKQAAEDAMPPGRSAAWRGLDVAVLQALVFDRLLKVQPGYVHSAIEARAAIDAGEVSLAFLLAPTPFEAVRMCAEAGESMPPKSTYFFPKPRSGVVMRLLS